MDPVTPGRIGALLLAVVVLGAPLAPGQSLGEMAQKEKQKRQAAKKAKAPAAQTFGDEDLEAYAGERPAPSESAEETPVATSATPATSGPPKKLGETPEEAERREATARKAEEARVRASWERAKSAVAVAERRVKEAEDILKTVPPGLPKGNYIQDIRDAVAQQQAERERALVLAKKELAAAREYRDAVEVEARRKSIRLE
jgi:hypothetical protein